MHCLLVKRALETAALSELDCFIEKLANMIRIVGVVKWQPVCFRKSHGHGSPQLGCRNVIAKSWIAEVGHPVKRVVGRMVDSIVAAKSHVGRSHSQVLQKRSEVGTRSQGTNARFRGRALLGFRPLVARPILPLLIDALS